MSGIVNEFDVHWADKLPRDIDLRGYHVHDCVR